MNYVGRICIIRAAFSSIELPHSLPAPNEAHLGDQPRSDCTRRFLEEGFQAEKRVEAEERMKVGGLSGCASENA
jgi:hypothetical protein